MRPLLALGFLIIRRVPRPDYVSAELIPSTIVSASECICPQFPGPYAIRWSHMSAAARESEFAEMRVPEPLREEAVVWATTALDSEFRWAGVFLTLAAAQKALRHFLPGDPDARLIGLGLDESMAEDFIAEAAPDESSYLDAVRGRQPLPDGGVRLGYELLDLEHGQLSHSWLCNGLEQHCADVLAIRPNPHGLIESLDDARLCCEEISREEVGAEPGYWLPVALIDYTTS